MAEQGGELASCWGYQTGDYLLTTYVAEQVDGRVELHIDTEEGDRERPERTVEVVVVTDTGSFSGSGSDASTITVELQ